MAERSDSVSEFEEAAYAALDAGVDPDTLTDTLEAVIEAHSVPREPVKRERKPSRFDVPGQGE